MAKAWNRKTAEMVGKRYGRLVVIADGPTTRDQASRLKVKCDCGVVKLVRAKYLRNGKTRSCGCYRLECVKTNPVTHGKTGSRIYRIWGNMMSRCFNKDSSHYSCYGGRGILVCIGWRSFDRFYRDIGEPPSSRHQLDRINNDGHYAPGNVRWATARQQQRNKRSNRKLTYGGLTMTLVEWSERLSISQSTLSSRVGKLGWSTERALAGRESDG